jgi:hypothetical protein
MDMFFKSLGVFTDALGVENAPAIVHLSMVPWPDDATRDSFIKALTGSDMSANF